METRPENEQTAWSLEQLKRLMTAVYVTSVTTIRAIVTQLLAYLCLPENHFITRTWLRYVRVIAIANPSVVCLSSVTFVRPTQGLELWAIFLRPRPPCGLRGSRGEAKVFIVGRGLSWLWGRTIAPTDNGVWGTAPKTILTLHVEICEF